MPNRFDLLFNVGVDKAALMALMFVDEHDERSMRIFERVKKAGVSLLAPVQSGQDAEFPFFWNMWG